MTIRLMTLGGLRGTHGEIELDWLRSQSIRAALLTYLALERTSSRDSLQLLIWPDAAAPSAAHRLKQNVLELRRALGDDCLETKGRAIIAGQELTADANDFEAAVGRGSYDEAIALYRGAFLSGVHLVDTNEFETWLDARRARHARMFRKACRSVVESRSGSGDHAGALSVAEEWADRDPGEDEAHLRIIEFHAQAGHRAEALAQYDAYRRGLERDGLEPLEQIRHLIAALRDVKPKPAERPPGPDLRARSADGPTRLGADIDPRLEPNVLQNLEVLRQIGSGAAARVYLARDVALQRLVALKVLHPDLANDAKARARFEREARAAARLSHPNIVIVHQVAELEDGTPYLVTEFIEGRNLGDTLEAEGVLSEVEVCSVLRQIAAALEAAHARGFIHRDVRPENIMWLRETGRAVLMDFGIVAVVESGAQASTRLTAKGEVMGDPRFTSPEQLLSSNVTVASDIYSLGVTGYVLLTGNGPHPDEKGARAIHAALDQRAVPLTTLRPGTNTDLSELMIRCLSVKPEHRPSAREVCRALDRVIEMASRT